MATLLLLAYGALCVVVFKLLRVPVNKWTVTTAGLGGVFIVGGLLLAMNYNHPFTSDGRLYFYTTAIAPTVSGRVVEVEVKANVALKQGDPLFRIDPQPYQFIVDQKRALLAEAKQNVGQLKASFDQATAGVEKAQAQLGLAQEQYDRQSELLQKEVVSQAALDIASRNLEAARQTLAQSQAAAERARLAFSSEIGGVNTTVARLQADLRHAEFNLAETQIAAPTDGFVTHLFLQPGMAASSSTPAMVFVHNGNSILSASFPQSVFQRVRVNDQAEIGFDAIPGRVFQAKVTVIADTISQGQVQAGGNLIHHEDRSQVPGRAVVRLEVTEDMSKVRLPVGATAQVAIYTDNFVALAAIRRLLLRMQAWLKYVVR